MGERAEGPGTLRVEALFGDALHAERALWSLGAGRRGAGAGAASGGAGGPGRGRGGASTAEDRSVRTDGREPRAEVRGGSGTGSGDIPMAGAAGGGKLNGMNPNTDIPTDAPATVTHGIRRLDARPPLAPGTRPPRSSQFRLRRSRTDRMLGGVCGGLAESLGADAALLRVLVVALTLITGGAAALIYLAAWVLAPEA